MGGAVKLGRGEECDQENKALEQCCSVRKWFTPLSFGEVGWLKEGDTHVTLSPWLI